MFPRLPSQGGKEKTEALGRAEKRRDAQRRDARVGFENHDSSIIGFNPVSANPHGLQSNPYEPYIYIYFLNKINWLLYTSFKKKTEDTSLGMCNRLKSRLL